MHVDGVESTTASMIAALRADGRSEIWWLIGSPCERQYTRTAFDELAGQGSSTAGSPVVIAPGSRTVA